MAREASKHLILLPGLLCDEDLWRDQLVALRGFVECRVADLTRQSTLAALATELLAEAPATFALAGFSFGGYVAQEVMRQAPERVERLCLLDTSTRSDTPERAAQRKAMLQAAKMPGAFKGIADRLLPTFIHPDRLADAALVERIKTMTMRVGRDVFLVQSAMERLDGEDVLRSLSCPASIICGDQDVLTPLSDHRAMAALVPDARLTVIANSGHMTPMEQPEAVSAALHTWLEQSDDR
ncbi:MAG: alpha/beta fold hydrolase [Hyphomicrobiales bacterium]|nr:alpha/beta fold hydrolase [Hyphomicrobiales bacterium]